MEMGKKDRSLSLFPCVVQKKEHGSTQREGGEPGREPSAATASQPAEL